MLDQGKLRAYADLVRLWSRRLDLIAPGDLERFESRHIEDSLRLVPLLDELPSGPCIDVGSGAGLPGVPLAIARPARHWRLLEPRTRRAAFLEEVTRVLELDCEVVVVPAEALRDGPLEESHALAVARALAPPTSAFELVEPLVVPGGLAAVFIGAEAEIPREAELWQPGIAIIRH